jgi:hypothetical protein
MRHYATNWKVSGSIPDGVIGICHWHNPFGCTIALGLTQLLANEYQEYFPGGEGTWRQPVCRADNLTTFMCPLSRNLGASTSWNPNGMSRPVMGLLYLTVIWHYRFLWLWVLSLWPSGMTPFSLVDRYCLLLLLFQWGWVEGGTFVPNFTVSHLRWHYLTTSVFLKLCCSITFGTLLLL